MNNNDIVKELQTRGYDAELHEVIKNGVSMKGIVIRSNDPMTPILYTDDLIEMAEDCGQGVEEVADVLIKKYEQQKNIFWKARILRPMKRLRKSRVSLKVLKRICM